MRLLAFLFILFVGTFTLAAPPTDQQVNEWIRQALAMSEQPSQGSSICQYAIPLPGREGFKSTGKDMLTAQKNLVLQCIKHECPLIGRKLMNGANDLFALPDEDIAEFFKSQGYTEKEIAVILKKKKSDTSTLASLDCSTVTQNARNYVVDSCLIVPIQCGEMR